MFFFLELYRNTKFIFRLAGLSVFLLVTGAGFASPTDIAPGSIAPGSISYTTTLGIDLDGDHIPETATIRQQGSFYQVSIHFSTGRPKLKLRTYVGDDFAGTLDVADINSDSEADIVVTSATSVRPIAVWLNHGKARFYRADIRTYGLTGRYTGLRLRRKPRNHAAPAGSLSKDRLPQAEVGDSFIFGSGLQDLVSSQTPPGTYQFWLAEAAPRGPPSAPSV